MAANLYEAMFVMDAAKGGSEFPGTVRHIADLLSRNGAEIERIEKWDERRLAYPIGRVKRGLYVLVYFRADGSAISEIRRLVGLSEELLRVLILRAEQPSPVKGELFSPDGEPVAVPEEAPAPPAPSEAEAGEPEQGAPAQAETPPPEGEEEAGQESQEAPPSEGPEGEEEG